MRQRTWVFLALILVLAVASACISSRVSRLPQGTPVPSKTLRPTFTSTIPKPTLEPTPTAAQPESAVPTVLVEKPTEAATPAEAPAEAAVGDKTAADGRRTASDGESGEAVGPEEFFKMFQHQRIGVGRQGRGCGHAVAHIAGNAQFVDHEIGRAHV